MRNLRLYSQVRNVDEADVTFCHSKNSSDVGFA